MASHTGRYAQWREEGAKGGVEERLRVESKLVGDWETGEGHSPWASLGTEQGSRLELEAWPQTSAPRQMTERVLAHTQVRDPRQSATACSWHALGTPSPGHQELDEVEKTRVDW